MTTRTTVRTITSYPPLTYQEISEQTGVPTGTLRQWVNRGKMPAPTGHVGQSPVWERDAVEQFIQDHTIRVPAP
jgi:excisionase family DNA binding protein